MPKVKKRTVVTYECSICKSSYSTEDEAIECEGKKISQDRGVKEGDIVIITQGDGTGKEALVKEVFIINKEWGHYAWKRYWHTVALEADIIGEWGTRMLTFDSYKCKKNENTR